MLRLTMRLSVWIDALSNYISALGFYNDAYNDFDKFWTADQTLKYQVRDAIINELQQDLANAADPQEAEQRICAEKDYIMNTAEKVIRSHGFSYPVSVSLEDRYFPTKQYGDLTFPPGTYRALCVEIGKSEGRNWWCVLFPCLCFVDETTAVVPEDSKQKLKQHITTEEYNRLTATSSPAPKKKTPSPSPKVSFHSGIYDWITSH